MGCTPPFILLFVNKPLHLSRWIAAIIDIVRFHQPLDQPQLVIAVQDLEVLGQTGFTPMLLQQAMSQAMKRTHPHAADRHIQQLLQTAFHFFCRFIGEGHRHQGKRRYIFNLEQPGNAMHQHAGFARACTCQYQLMGGLRSHRITLAIV